MIDVVRLRAASSDESFRDAMAPEGISVTNTDDADEAVEYAVQLGRPVIIDEPLEGFRTAGMLRDMRRNSLSHPVIANLSEQDTRRVSALFAIGFTDCLDTSMPDAIKAARIKAARLRSFGFATERITIGPFKYDSGTERFTVCDEPVKFPQGQHRVLVALMMANGRPLSRGALIDQIYTGVDAPAPKIMDVFVANLRLALEPYGADGHIETVYGRGYRISETPVARRRHSAARRKVWEYRSSKIIVALDRFDEPVLAAKIADELDVPGNLVRGAIGTMVRSGTVIKSGARQSWMQAGDAWVEYRLSEKGRKLAARLRQQMKENGVKV